MNPKANPLDAALPGPQLLEVNKICREFEADWKAGRHPQPADYLGTTPEPQRSQLSRQLEAIEAELRARSKSQFSVAEFVQRVTSSGLMTVEEMSTFVSTLPADKQPKTAEDLARQMYSQGRLTRFQAQAIYQGKTRGLVVGNYVMLDKLGEGGMGQVYKARHRKMERVVALKMLPSSATKVPDAVKRFEREAKAAAKLVHPNIVTAYDADEHNGVYFLVMEFVDGQDLSALVKRDGSLRVGQAVDCVVQAARGLEYAHRQGVIHRDIKPSNLLLDHSGTVKILDMGLARMEGTVGGKDDGLTLSGSVMGTLDYMAPEQALDTHDANAKSDIYSLGCTLHYLLTGQSPYHGDTVAKKLLAHREEPVPSLRAVRSDVPEWLDKVFQRMLAKKPADRPQTMSEAIGELQQHELPWSRETAPASVTHGSLDETLSLHRGEIDTSSRQIEIDQPGEELGKALAPVRFQRWKSWTPALLVKLSKRQRVGVGVAAGLAFLVVLLAIVLSVRTKHGTLVVELSDPDVKVQVVSEEGKVLIDRPGEKGTMTISVDPGKHRLRIEKNGMEVYGDDVTIASGGTTGPIRAKWEPIAQVAKGQPGPPRAVAPFDAAKAKGHQKAWAQYLGVPAEMTNSIGMKFALIPPGEFDMGTSDADFERLMAESDGPINNMLESDIPAGYQWYREFIDSERPQHHVTITRPFYLGVCEVTRSQYLAVSGAPAPPDGNMDQATGDVSWYDARRFCNGLTARPEEKGKGFVYRLSTEAEWEYACRAGTTTRYCSGDTAADVYRCGWCNETPIGNVRSGGGKEANAWGLYDMHGNLWEMCADWYGVDYYKRSPRNDPTGPSVGNQRITTQFSATTLRVVRGGCSCDWPMTCRSSSRSLCEPSQRTGFKGFRVAVSIPLPGSAESAARNDVVMADFEGPDFGDWKVEGTAFGSGPAHGALPNQQPVTGFVGKGFASSYHDGDTATGKLTSPEFTISRKYITFLIGGGRQMEGVAVNLLVDGKMVRTASPVTGFEELLPWGWDVTNLEHKRARIEIADQSSSGWAHISIDQIEMSDEAMAPNLSKYVPTPLVVADNVVADADGLDYAGEKIKDVPSGSVGVWLDTLDLSVIEQGWEHAQASKSVDGNPMRIGGRPFARGVGSHSVGLWRIDLKKDAVKLLAMVGVDDEVYNRGTVCFQAWLDGKKIADSGVMRGLDEAKRLEADLSGGKELLLVVTDAGDGGYSDHADWANAMIVVKPGGAKPESLKRYEPPAPALARDDSPTPAICGPRVVGNTPGRPFQFCIPATGEQPLSYSAKNLPSGLTLDAKKGILSGTVPWRGSIVVELQAANARGKAKRKLTIASDRHKLALTPPMGWNSAYCWRNDVSDEKIRAAADALVQSGLAAHGYQYVVVDDGWLRGRNGNGALQPNEKFPDMKALADYVHGKGLKLGIFMFSGNIPPSQSSNQHERQDAATLAEWGIDYLIYGGPSNYGPNPDRATLMKPYLAMGIALDDCGRDVVFNLCQIGRGRVWEWSQEVGGSLWRTASNTVDSWDRISEIGFDKAAKIAPHVSPGQWNDLDKLMVGVVCGGFNDPGLEHPPRPSGLTPHEQASQVTLWSLLAAPLMISCDLTKLDAFTLALLTNPEVIDVDQDPLGKAAARVKQDGPYEVWARPLFDGTQAVGLFNRGPQPATIRVAWQDLGLAGEQPVRDLWQRKDLGANSGGFEAVVEPHGAALLKIGAAKTSEFVQPSTQVVGRNVMKPSWAPGGDKLVVAVMPFGSGLRIIDLKTGKIDDLLNFGKDPEWSPGQGRWIAFVKGEMGWDNTEVWIVESSGKNPRKIAEGGWPSWSADGKTLYFRSNVQQKVLAIEPGAKEARAVEVCDMPWSYFPSISPDGKQVSYVDDGSRLHILDRNTQQTVLSLALPSKAPFPWHSWSHDQKRIALGIRSGDSESTDTLSILDLKTKKASNILSGPYCVCSWSPDDSKIAVDYRPPEPNEHEVWVIDVPQE
jgi:alpha-galactosidase